MPTPQWLLEPIKKIFPYRRFFARLTRLPAFAWLLDKTLLNGNDLIYLPKDRVAVRQAIEAPESFVLPSTLVDHFIEQASHRWIMNFCICRQSDHCQEYPPDFGCLFLGEAAQKINPRFGRLASKEEALEHARRAREMGLIQVIGHDRIDYTWLGVRPFNKLMTICNCCPCCCLWKVIPDLDRKNRGKIRRMPGVNVWVEEDKCSGCGACTREVCFVKAIRVEDGKACISTECRGCGRCVEVCPRGAIHMHIAGSGYVQEQIERISRIIDVSGESG